MATAKIADLTIDEFKALVREAVQETPAELDGDPDKGNELRHEFVAEARNSLAAVQSGAKTIPAGEVARNLGLTL